jgi:hypothetical protein
MFDLFAYSAITFYSAVVVLALGRGFEPTAIFFWFNIVFTIAHYAPTWTRAFLDRTVLRQNRWQILLFPPAFFLFAWGTAKSPQALAFVLYFWDRAHALLQNYGFLRLYEARAFKGDPAVSPGAERALLFSGALLTMSFNYGLVTQPLGVLAGLGVPLPLSGSFTVALRSTFGAATLASAVWYALQLRRGVMNGKPLHLPKLVFLAAMFGGHALMNLTSSIFLLSAHEKVYHSVQYLVLSQQYSQRRARTAKKGELAGAFSRLAKVPFFALFVAAWTVVAFTVAQHFGGAALLTTVPFNAVLGGVALTHYFFDSFLWRVRRPEVSANL